MNFLFKLFFELSKLFFKGDVGNDQCIGDTCGDLTNDDNFDTFEDPDGSFVEVTDEDIDALDADEFVDNRVDVGHEMMDVDEREFDDDEFVNEPPGKNALSAI